MFDISLIGISDRVGVRGEIILADDREKLAGVKRVIRVSPIIHT